MGTTVQRESTIFHDVLQGLSKKDQKAFKQRIKYWESKPEVESSEEALQLALHALKRKKVSNRTDDISQEEIDKVVAKIQAKNKKYSIPPIVCSTESENLTYLKPAENLPQTTRNPAAPDFGQIASVTKTCAAKLACFLPLVAILMAIGLTSALLIDRTLDVLGATGWQNYGKAVLIELAILFLTLSHCASQLEWWLKKSAALAFIVLSFLYLHVGTAQQVEANQLAAINTDQTLTLLRSQYDRAEADYNALGPNFITKKKETRDELDRLSKSIIQHQESMRGSASINTIQVAGVSESFLWFCLLSLNLFLGHEALKKTEKVNVQAEEGLS